MVKEKALWFSALNVDGRRRLNFREGIPKMR
jgi:hypothetical protein